MQPQEIKQLIPTNLLQETALDVYKEFAGTPEEEFRIAAEAILDFRKKKYSAYKSKVYWSQLSEPKKIPTFTSEQYFEYITKVKSKDVYKLSDTGLPKFVLTTYNEHVLRLLCHYFTNDKRFEEHEEGFSLEKGIMLFGKVGTGKTSIMKLFRDNPKKSFVIKPCRDVANDFALDGEAALEIYTKPYPMPSNTGLFGHKEFGMCFDDLGTEQIKKNFGNESNTMADILLSRYDNKTDLLAQTHVTMNLSVEDIEDRYGLRVRSRAREMFNLIEFGKEAPDMRK